MKIFVAVLLSVFVSVQATSAQPSAQERDGTSKTSRSKVIKKNGQREAEQPKTNKLSSAINELTAAIRDSKVHTADEGQNEKMHLERESLKADTKIADETENLARYTDTLAGFTLLLVIVGSLQLGLFFWQLRLMKQATIDAGKSAEAAYKTAQNIEVSERAYVQISHMTPLEINPGLYRGRIQIRVKNFGRTPARITDELLNLGVFGKVDPLPERPDYKKMPDHAATKGFLLPGDEIFTWEVIENREIDISKVNSGEQVLLLFGYVDYTDHFGNHHRSGFGRRYHPGPIGGDSTLSYIPLGGYNYDERTKPDDGNNKVRKST